MRCMPPENGERMRRTVDTDTPSQRACVGYHARDPSDAVDTDRVRRDAERQPAGG